MKLKKIALVLATTFMASATFAAGDTLIYCSEGSPAGFDSAQYTSGTDFDAAGHAVFDRLIGFKPGSTEIEPALATKWDISADGKTYTFYLRPGVKFHTTENFTPTRDFQAEDVLLSFGRMVKKTHPMNKLYPAE